jgi:hypothetical protein
VEVETAGRLEKEITSGKGQIKVGAERSTHCAQTVTAAGKRAEKGNRTDLRRVRQQTTVRALRITSGLGGWRAHFSHTLDLAALTSTSTAGGSSGGFCWRAAVLSSRTWISVDDRARQAAERGPPPAPMPGRAPLSATLVRPGRWDIEMQPTGGVPSKAHRNWDDRHSRRRGHGGRRVSHDGQQ